jgi:BCD family chlorophyll transporter-like MFS transporter
MLTKVISILNSLRLALFPIAYGIMGALVGGTLNRLLVAELGLSVTLVGFFFAIPLLTSPIRIWIGHYADAHPILGTRRESFLWGGALLAALGLVSVTMTTAASLTPGGAILFGMFLAFVVYGFGRNMAHNSFQALLAEKFSGGSKRYITLFEVATLFGSVMAAGAIGKMLETYDPARLVSVAVGVGILVIVLAVTATLGQENRKFTITSEQARQKDFGKAVRELILFDPQARLFFVLVLFTFIGTLAQDVLLEPYGALVLNMSVGETTRLTAFWGIGVLISMLLSGTLLLKWLDYKLVLRIGLIISLLTFIGLVVVGLAGNPTIFRQLVLVMGLGSGLAGAGLLTGVISFTTPVRAGLLMGVWGMANLLGRAVGSLMGGAIVDGIQLLSGNAFSAYAVVFALEAVMLGISLVLSFRLQIEGALAQQEAQEFELASATAN